MSQGSLGVPPAPFRFRGLMALALHFLAACSPTSPPASAPTLSILPIPSPMGNQTATPRKPTPPAHTSSPAPTPVDLPTDAVAPTRTGLPQCQPPEEWAHVLDVRDGDTIQVQLGNGEIETVRYIGIDAPEQNDSLYELSAEANESLVMDRDVCLWKDVSDRDGYGRLLRFVRVDSIFVNDWLVEHGFALAWAYSPDTSMASVFEESQQKAIAAGVGLWEWTTPTAALPPPTPAGTAALGPCDPSYPTVCIPSPPPDLDCGEITFRRFTVKPPDPHRFDSDGDGIGCEGN